MLALVRQQPTLALQATAEAGQGRIGTDHAVAWNDNRHGIRALPGPPRGAPRGPAMFWPHRPMAERGSGGNPAQRAPPPALKVSTTSRGANRLDRVQLTLEVSFEREPRAGRGARVQDR